MKCWVVWMDDHCGTAPNVYLLIIFELRHYAWTIVHHWNQFSLSGRNHLLILISGYLGRLTHQLAPKSIRKLNYLSPLSLLKMVSTRERELIPTTTGISLTVYQWIKVRDAVLFLWSDCLTEQDEVLGCLDGRPETVQTFIQIKHYKNTLNSKIYVQLYLQMMNYCSRVMSQFKNNQKINIWSSSTMVVTRERRTDSHHNWN
jgi:hypothetical protein